MLLLAIWMVEEEKMGLKPSHLCLAFTTNGRRGGSRSTFFLKCVCLFFLDHRYSGEVRLMMHYANANRAATGYANSAPPYGAPVPQVSSYSAPPPAYGASYSQPPTAYPGSYPYPSYPPSSAYPPSAYPPPPTATYPPAPYPAPSAYPPQPYPPPPQASAYYPPGN
ncbi:hypothetical protein DKX38_025057 [Salix brachista]|uniref:Uncharacterized protein n=1 Tax=Salix brachista TaxID=2182728 RepID=A0A5N5JN02_9ROSI|nr:hypothetical protein DKX38_025057 [Salix brachista]